MNRLSRVCAEHAGQPNSTHRACTGCPDCPCHHVAAPTNFRDLVARHRARAETSPARGAGEGPRAGDHQG